jgi:hypothetical protein
MVKGKEAKPFDLEERAFRFALDVRALLKTLPRNAGNMIDGRQLLRASGSVGANYIEANDCLSKKDFLLRAKIAAAKPVSAASSCDCSIRAAIAPHTHSEKH